MPQRITRSARDIVKKATAEVSAISAEEALGLVGSPEHVFVDRRDSTEQAKTSVIEVVGRSSRGMEEFHIETESTASGPDSDQGKICDYCRASGGRAAMAAKAAMARGLAPVLNLTGGVGAWTTAGVAAV